MSFAVAAVDQFKGGQTPYILLSNVFEEKMFGRCPMKRSLYIHQ
jgi:hypothetical protein